MSQAYAVLAGLAGDEPLESGLDALLSALSADTGPGLFEIWRIEDAKARVCRSWPPAERGANKGRLLADRPVGPRLRQALGVDLCAPIGDERAVLGAVTYTLLSGRRTPAGLQGRLEETAVCAGVLWHRDALVGDVRRQDRHTRQLAGALVDARRRLASVRDQERRRVASEILALSNERLAPLGRRLDVVAQNSANSTMISEVRSDLRDLVENFRRMVRGVHPRVLSERGARVALDELLADLPGPVWITGTLPTRVDPEIGASIYRLTVAALKALARTESGSVVQVQLGEVGHCLVATVTCEREALQTGSLRAAMAIDMDRVAALGGRVDVSRHDATVRVRAELPLRLEPEAVATRHHGQGLAQRVRTLALGLLGECPPGPAADRVQALLGRLEEPVRMSVPRACWSIEAAALRSLGHRLPGLELSIGENDAAEMADVILKPSPEQGGGHWPNHLVDVGLLGLGVLIRAATWSDLQALLQVEVVARADILRARSVLQRLSAAIDEIDLSAASKRWFRYEIERASLGARDLVELETLAVLRADLAGRSDPWLRSAENLLGVRGPEPHQRLGLPASAGQDELFAAASEHLAHWLRALENVGVPRQSREAYRSLAQACERLLVYPRT